MSRRCAGALLRAAFTSVCLVSAAAETNPDRSDLSPALLSPFVVRADQAAGYEAFATLAGTRLNTPLADVAASITVVTRQLLEDTAATQAVDVLVFTPGTEVAGLSGNYSGSGSASFLEQRQALSPVTRLRGLAEADITRNFFGTAIPLDAYDTEQVTISRGANAVLFGLGSPAGIVDHATIVPAFRNQGRVQLTAGSYGSVRQVLDFDRVFVRDKLAARLAQVHERERFEQDPARRNQDRIHGIVTYRPFNGLTLQAGYEVGSIWQRLPRIDPPRDSVSAWFAYGKPIRDTSWWPQPFGLAEPTQNYQRYHNLDGAFGNFFYSPAAFFSGPRATTTVTDSFPSFADIPVSVPGAVQYRYLSPRPANEAAQFARLVPDPVAAFNVDPQIIDRSAFDYRKQMLDGPNNQVTSRFSVADGTIEQLFLDGDAGLEAAWNDEHLRFDRYEAITSARGNAIAIDVNAQTIDGRPNPNFGRPYVASPGLGARDFFYTEHLRFTGFVRHDFRRSAHALLGWWLGRQGVTGFGTDTTNQHFALRADPVILDTGYSSSNSNALNQRLLAPVVYIGPSLLGATGLAGAHLSAITTPIQFPATLDTYVLNAGTGFTWSRQTHSVFQYPDFSHVARDVYATRDRVRSHGAVWQGYWAGDLLVTTLGWRRDAVHSFYGDNDRTFDPLTGARPVFRPALSPTASANQARFSQGYALHLPTRWQASVPGGVVPTLYYDGSSNMQITDARQTIFGVPLDPQMGTTHEYGAGLTALDGKISARVMRYRSVQANTTDRRTNPLLRQFAVLEQRIYQSNSPAALAAAGYVGFLSPDASPILRRYAQAWRLTDNGPLPNGGRDVSYTSPASVAEVTSAISDGVEMELVAQPTRFWRLVVNAAEDNARRGPAAEELMQLLRDREQYWGKDAVKNLPAGPDYTIGSFGATVLQYPLETAALSAGQPTAELRKWRANAIVTHEFAPESRLHGWTLGGSVRWQGPIALGYPVITNPYGGLRQDTAHPFMGDAETTVDAWLAYAWRWQHLRWKAQLNVRNLLNDNLLIPTYANAVAVDDRTHFTIAQWRMGEARTFRLSLAASF